MEGIIRWIRLKFDKKSGDQAADQMQDAVVKGTDPKKPIDNLKKIENQAKRLGAAIKAAIPILGVVAFARAALRATNENAAALAQLDNIVRLTGEGAGFTTAQLAQMSTEMSRASTTSSAAVQGGLTRLLAYTNIQGDSFLRAAQAALDMSETLKIDMTSAAETLGRALDDPINGLTALSRQGFKFGPSQQMVIDQMVRTNDIAGAQAIVLDVIESNYENAAKAARGTLGGALSALKNEFDDQIALTNESSSGLARFINTITEHMPKAFDVLAQFFGGFKLVVLDIDEAIAKAELGMVKLVDRVFGRFSNADVVGAQAIFDMHIRRIEAARQRIEDDYTARITRVSTLQGPLAGFEFDRGKEIAAAIAATQNLIATLEKERDGLKFSRLELMQKSQEYLNATPTQRAYIDELFNEAEMIREVNRANAEREAQAKREEAERERRTQGVIKHIAALDAELASLDMSERQIFQTSEAFRDAEQGQREYMLSIYDAIQARREQIQAEKDAAAEMERVSRQLQMAAEENTRRMADAFQPFFDGMALSLLGMAEQANSVKSMFHGFGAELVAQMIEGKAEMSMADAIQALASGTWPPNPAALKAAALHMSAAAAYRAISAKGSKTRSSANMSAATQTQAARSAPMAPEVNIYIDPLNPSNPAWQANIAQTLRGVTQRYGNANVNVKPRTS